LYLASILLDFWSSIEFASFLPCLIIWTWLHGQCSEHASSVE
jgi:hypothetical protein